MKRHLDYSGCTHEIFPEKVTGEIYRYSAGSARAINKEGTHALMYAAQIIKKIIEGEFPSEVLLSINEQSHSVTHYGLKKIAGHNRLYPASEHSSFRTNLGSYQCLLKEYLFIIKNENFTYDS